MSDIEGGQPLPAQGLRDGASPGDSSNSTGRHSWLDSILPSRQHTGGGEGFGHYQRPLSPFDPAQEET
jgi:hypothetical protein